MKMSVYQYQGVVTALTSISHIGETRGITSLLRREKIINAAGDDFEEVPIISGNSVRGRLRDIGMAHMCRMLGYGVIEKNDGELEIQGLSLPAFYFLFSGGSLTKEAGKAIDIDAARAFRELIPLVSIFGSAVGNMIMDGKLLGGKLQPICAETAHLLPERFVRNGYSSDTGKPSSSVELLSIWSMIQLEAYTRRDDEKNDSLRQLIAPAERKLLEANNAAKLAKQRDSNDVDIEIGKHQQMRYFVETFAAGTRFFTEFILKDPTDVEYEAFMITLVEFSRMPYIGGKSAIGHGKIKMQFDNWTEINPNLSLTGQEVALPIGSKYADHLRNNGQKIRALLAEIK